MQASRPLYKYLKDPATKTWFNHIYLNAHKYQFGWIEARTGGVRMGKSKSIATEAMLLTKNPLDEYNFGFTPKEYIRNLDQCETGEIQVWSEIGTAMNARKWQSASNIASTEIVQTMMIKKPIVFMDCPDLSFIDVVARKVIYAYSEAKRWEDSPVKLYQHRIDVNRKEGTIYFPHPLVKFNGIIHKLMYIKLANLPEKCEAWEKYHEREIVYKERLRKKNLPILEDMEKDFGEQKTVYDYINDIMSDPNKDRFMSRGIYSSRLIRTIKDISERKSEDIAKFINKQLELKEKEGARGQTDA